MLESKNQSIEFRCYASINNQESREPPLWRPQYCIWRQGPDFIVDTQLWSMLAKLGDLGRVIVGGNKQNSIGMIRIPS